MERVWAASEARKQGGRSAVGRRRLALAAAAGERLVDAEKGVPPVGGPWD